MLAWICRTTGPRGSAVRAVTSRAGGTSGGSYAGLNLGDHVGDDPGAVAANRRAVADEVGVPVERLLVARQVHGRRVAVADGPWTGEPPDADGIVTREQGLALAVLVADCVPVLLAAPSDGVVGVAHAGRRGLVEGVVPAVVDEMRRLGATRVVATLGPSVCARCYEVPQALRDEVADRHPVASSVTWSGSPSIDVAGGVLEQLCAAGVDAEQVRGCTVEDEQLFSYRRDGATGRFAGLAWLESS